MLWKKFWVWFRAAYWLNGGSSNDHNSFDEADSKAEFNSDNKDTNVNNDEYFEKVDIDWALSDNFPQPPSAFSLSISRSVIVERSSG